MSLFDDLRSAVAEGRAVALATVVSGPGVGAKVLVGADGTVRGELADADLHRVVVRDTRGALARGATGLRRYGPCGQAVPLGVPDEQVVTVFVESFAPPPTMIVVGAVDFARALARVGRVLGFRVVVCDARVAFATTARFPEADEVVVDWPQRLLEARAGSLGADDAVCVLTHEARFDVPAIRAALDTAVGYVGAMGSRRTHEDRLGRLRAAGVADAALARLRSPIGLDLGARTPEETAVAICAEIIAIRSGRSGRPLSETTGPIH